MNNKGFTTRLVHADRVLNQPENGAVHQPRTNSVLFEYKQVEDLVDIFQGRVAGHAYSRQSSPSIDALQNMLAQMEEGIGALTFATGMAAITTTLLTLLQSGDHIIISQFVFGNTNSFANTLQRFGIEVTMVDVTEVENVANAIQPNTKAVFVETIANPATQIADLQGIGELCQQRSLVYIVDNTMTPAFLFKAKNVGASLIVSSLTKYVAGHGHVLGGAVVDTGLFDWTSFTGILPELRKLPVQAQALTQIKKKGLRDMGGCLTADSAHAISVGMETLALRMERTCNNAIELAAFLNGHDKVEHVYYPGLASHPQHQRAREQFKMFGGILSLDLKPGLDCFKFINHLELVLNATHLGDTRTLAIPVAHTIFYEMGAETRARMGIGDNMIRFSIGIEDCVDIIADFAQALEQI
ncbi:cystathionine gamma-synthase family protein [Paraneptunicella aestuarii]|uniref:cystathionine gamma-synthase family protein n=1 Tax=Paraneptunicella aestuarii TaxID=2831148 RepID=UPI001E5F9F9B|nr:cystathionine gamma-synthase family protein [Paraneptunicella aestuarii]UAA40504.1 cystathionine gamma-synthase family protein [Paraneptunicella aestuarii]